MVDLVPGNKIISASTGITSPGRTKIKSTPGSILKGSRSSKLAILESWGTATINSFLSELTIAFSPIASSAGSFEASSNHGITPSPFHLVNFSICAIPSENSDTSPRNLLIIKALICALSISESTALVPTILAIMPPLSISPIKTTGILATVANPILAISFARRLISAGLPAPSINTKSASSLIFS